MPLGNSWQQKPTMTRPFPKIWFFTKGKQILVWIYYFDVGLMLLVICQLTRVSSISSSSYRAETLFPLPVKVLDIISSISGNCILKWR